MDGTITMFNAQLAALLVGNLFTLFMLQTLEAKPTSYLGTLLTSTNYIFIMGMILGLNSGRYSTISELPVVYDVFFYIIITRAVLAFICYTIQYFGTSDIGLKPTTGVVVSAIAISCVMVTLIVAVVSLLI